MRSKTPGEPKTVWAAPIAMIAKPPAKARAGPTSSRIPVTSSSRGPFRVFTASRDPTDEPAALREARATRACAFGVSAVRTTVAAFGGARDAVEAQQRVAQEVDAEDEERLGRRCVAIVVETCTIGAATAPGIARMRASTSAVDRAGARARDDPLGRAGEIARGPLGGRDDARVRRSRRPRTAPTASAIAQKPSAVRRRCRAKYRRLKSASRLPSARIVSLSLTSRRPSRSRIWRRRDRGRVLVVRDDHDACAAPPRPASSSQDARGRSRCRGCPSARRRARSRDS